MEILKGKVAIVTGGSSGIGKATMVRLASEGAVVVNWDINSERGLALVEELTTKGFESHFSKVDTSNLEGVIAATEEVIAKYNKIDILINNAGILRDATLVKMDNEKWQQVIDVNLTGVFNCAKAVVPHMISNASGRIVNMSSIVGLHGNFGQTNYAAAKAGVIAMTQTWGKELGGKGINVNAIAPGFIHTEILDSMPTEVLDRMKAKVPLKRLGTAEEIANMILFLVSDQANYVNGAVISVDGGVSL